MPSFQGHTSHQTKPQIKESISEAKIENEDATMLPSAAGPVLIQH
jgi:hypothetical protein